MTSGERIIAEARRWLGTPWHHMADVRGAGVDCGMLIVRAIVDSGLAEPFDPRPYTKDWFLHRDDERFIDRVIAGRFREVEDPEAGDVILFRNGRAFSHAGIVTRVAPMIIIHAYSPARGVVEQALDEVVELAGAARRIFRLEGGA